MLKVRFRACPETEAYRVTDSGEVAELASTLLDREAFLLNQHHRNIPDVGYLEEDDRASVQCNHTHE